MDLWTRIFMRATCRKMVSLRRQRLVSQWSIRGQVSFFWGESGRAARPDAGRAWRNRGARSKCDLRSHAPVLSWLGLFFDSRRAFGYLSRRGVGSRHALKRACHTRRAHAGRQPCASPFASIGRSRGPISAAPALLTLPVTTTARPARRRVLALAKARQRQPHVAKVLAPADTSRSRGALDTSAYKITHSSQTTDLNEVFLEIRNSGDQQRSTADRRSGAPPPPSLGSHNRPRRFLVHVNTRRDRPEAS